MIRLACFTILLALAAPAAAQQDPGFFIPGGQPSQRPPGAAPPARPPAAAQRPPTAPPQAAGQPQNPRQPPAIIGVVDVPEVQRLSAALTQVREELEKRNQKLEADLQREQGAWREQQQGLANERATLAAEALRTRERDLQNRITDSQRIFRERKRALDQTAQTALTQIERTLGQTIQQVAESRGLNLVLQRGLVIMNAPQFDMTEQVAELLNKTLRSVALPPEGAEEKPPAPAAARTPPPSTPAAAPAAPPPGPRR